MIQLNSIGNREKQKDISARILSELQKYDFYFSTPILADAWEQTKKIAVKGKNIRSLLYLNLAQSDAKIELAVAIELYQLALLIHDDIMDDDNYRRGEKSVHAFLFSKMDEHDGVSMAICIGDILIFIANALISEHYSHAHVISRKLIETGIGQSIDVSLTHSLPSVDLMKKMYIYKTATYTFEIPLCLALGETENRTKISHNLGILYQITDDLLTIEHSLEETGKSQFNDVSHSKPTYIICRLYEVSSDSDKIELVSFYKKTGHTFEEIVAIQQLLIKHDVVLSVREDIAQLAAQTKKLIEQEESLIQKHLLNVLEFIEKRSN